MKPTDHATPPAAQAGKIGLVAGWGDYPIVVARALSAQGFEVHALGVRDHADEARLAPLCTSYRRISMSRIGGALSWCKRRGIRRVTMAGKIHKTRIYGPLVWLKNIPDLRTLRMFFDNFVLTRRDRRDDTLLGTIVAEAARDGIEIAPATDFAPELLVKFGQLTRRAPSTLERKDAEFGWRMAKEMGRLDVGQCVVVKGRNVLAVEAIEGTDACIRRAGELCESGNFTVVKVAKPRQDMRFDVPAIGLGTLEQMVAAGATCLAIEARKTIVIGAADVVRFADRHRLSIIALEAGEQAETFDASATRAA